MATEINTKVDILVLSAFASTAEVGVYSIAALIFEGLAQIPFVLRTVVNSKLSVLTQRERVDELRVFFRPIKWAMIVGMTAVALVTVLLFPVFVDLILGDTTFRQAWLPLTILLFSLAAASGYLPLDMVLTQGRQPMAQSLLKTLVVSINLIMNILLVPFFGMIGAAMGTACATISTAILTVVMMHRYLGVHA